MKASLLDRRPPTRGDQRRTQLLRALEDLLRERRLDEITIGDVSARAGVTRSGFYFYFENKAVAVAALAVELHDKVVLGAFETVVEHTTPRDRIEAQTAALIDSWSRHGWLHQALLDARRSSAEVRAAWDSARDAWVAPLADLIDAERASGAAPPGPDSTALATLLLAANDSTLEQLSSGHPLALDGRVAALSALWVRAIYGTELGR